MRIFVEDTEEVKDCKRRLNIKEMRKDHQRGAERLPLGIPIRCKVEQLRDMIKEDYNGKQGAGGYSNGMMRIRWYDGKNNGHYGYVFAGNSHSNFLTGMNKDAIAINLNLRCGVTQGKRAKKGKGVTGKRGGKRINAGRAKNS